MSAVRTLGPRPDDREIARPARDTDVEERANDGSEHEREDRVEGLDDHVRSVYRRIPVATATLSDSTPGDSGSATVRSARERASVETPAPSLPTTSTTRLGGCIDAIDSPAPSATNS